MNERIKELAEQVLSADPKYAVAMIIASPELEKFAELIIKECCYIVGDYYGQSKKSGPGYTMICEIKEHFGVE